MEPRPVDLLSDAELALLTKMLKAVFDYQHLHVNRFRVQAMVGHRFQYFVGKKGSGAEIFSLTVFDSNIKGRLVAIGFAETDRSPGAPDGTMRFTDKAEAWYRQGVQRQSEVTAGDIQQAIGEHLYARRQRENNPGPIDIDVMAGVLGVTPNRIAEQLDNLSDLEFIRPAGSVYEIGRPTPFIPGDLHLTRKGVAWATGGYRSIGDFDAVTVNVNLEVNIEIRQFLSEIQEIDADPEQVEEATNLVLAFQENPSVETLAPLMAFGANTLTFLVPILNLIMTNGDFIKRVLSGSPLL